MGFVAGAVAALAVFWSVVFTPLLLLVVCIIALASLGRSLGVRRLYVRLLLHLFEYGRQHIEVANKLKRVDSFPEENEADDQNNDGGVVIQRERVLVPDKGFGRSQPTTNGNSANGKSALSITPVENEPAALEFDFDLSTCLEYIKAGVESIIEDQVTSVFEAEELRSWNLLTRTNRHYEFVSWRLTVIWMMGFFVRYFFLFPLRVFICFVGVVWIVGMLALVGHLPPGRVKTALGVYAYKIGFRIMMRSLSGYLRFHNVEYRPKKGGFCVANHTSPIDVILLSSETCFCLVASLTACTALVGCLREGEPRRRANRRLSAACFALLSRSISAVVTYHGEPPRGPGICVANHTSPIDALMLMCDNCYSLIGQRHGGFLGILQRALARASPHIWFERSEVKDRHAVTNRLKEHVSDPNNPPILIFPEGTCINNTSVMQFKKGSFEVGGVIYPVAIKYDPKFGDAFWNSSRYSMMQYLYMMMTSWAIVCDVWYLPPMYRRSNETAVEFANRVKSVIARQGGLVDLVWDGQLKRMKAKKEWKELQQEEFSRRLKGE
ncbi:glycerol-3-phosphate acyltransferase 4 isoform X2 [Arctopsyche grandis]|uniref:glycerol-3-phosphate acyltransferase 4 isoform X2 n=1 Tax=Arctopsyche grandis TaxID=121162 RepID=UPI00406D74B5